MTLEEYFVEEHTKLKQELQDVTEERDSCKRALQKINNELKSLKNILIKHTEGPILVNPKTQLPDNTLYIQFSTYSWSLTEDPDLKDEIQYLLTFLPYEELKEEEDEKVVDTDEAK